MSTAVPHEFQRFVKQEVASGKYRSADEVVSAGLRLLQERERKREALVQDLQVGIDQLEQGQGIPIADEKAHHQFFRDIAGRSQPGRRKRAKP